MNLFLKRERYFRRYAMKGYRCCTALISHFRNGVPEQGTPEYYVWYQSCIDSQNAYNCLLKMGRSPQEARSVLPNSLKTEIVVTMNLREWIHFFSLRAVGTTGKPHPQMRESALPVLKAFAEALPEIFGDLYQQAIFE